MSDLMKKATDALTAAGFTSPDVDRPDLWVRDDGMCRESVSFGTTRARVSLNVPIEQVPSILSPDPDILRGGVMLTEEDWTLIREALRAAKAKAEKDCEWSSNYALAKAHAARAEAYQSLLTRLTGGGA